MNHFYVIQNNVVKPLNESFSGFAIYYKKNKDEKIASIQLDLMMKLIQNGLKLSVENFLLLDLNEDKTRLSSLLKSIEIKKCILFGVNENEIGINIVIPVYQIVKIADIEFLRCDTPEKLAENNHLKNLLWQQLKIAFKIS